MNQLTIREALERDKDAIIKFSQDWEAEKITYGYKANAYEALNRYRIRCAVDGEAVVGYLMGEKKTCEGFCVIPKSADYFEIEDLYIAPAYRNKGAGKALFDYAERTLKAEGVHSVLLSTATKDYKKIQSFYTKKADMTVWTTTFFKNI